ncbi:Protein kinase C iota type [Heterocephalus glaber]|uniref:Protein kinase C iota type n=1 Tax=Heterocephalus glaber TaxID=10181 RepID=G5ALG7_HETGA|nr:Protein kinase C iota type [Heterocephalus glaber]
MYFTGQNSEKLEEQSPCPQCRGEHPKVPCPGGEKSICHRAAGHWRKLYCVNGHTFQAKHFSRRAHCTVCTDHVGGLGHQVYKCTNCKLSVHKKCHKLVTIECGQHSLPSETMVPVDPSSMASDPAHTAIPHNLSTHEALEQADEENEAGNTGEGGKASSGLGLEDFYLLHVIGRGSYGKILLVQLKKSDRMYAMKAVKKELFYIHQALGVLMYMMMIGESPFHLDECSDIPFEDSIKNLFRVILERDIFIPRCLSVQAASILEGFLNRDPKEQLGCHPHRGFGDVQEHPFFQNVDWDMMEQKQVVPPFKPNISEEFSLDNFDPEFTNQPVWLTSGDNDIVRELDGNEFASFEYINHLMMYEEEGV